MENMVMMPPSTTNGADISDDESEIISLDLHVSDNEEVIAETTKKEPPLESEEEILNKFINEEEEPKKQLVNGHTENGCAESTESPTEKEALDKPLVNGEEKVDEPDLNKDNGSPSKDDSGEIEEATKKTEKEEEAEEKKEEVMLPAKAEDAKVETEDVTDNTKEETVKSDSENDPAQNDCDDALVTVQSESSETDKKDKGEEENQEDEDLLLVMETSFVDEADKDENSCSSSEKDEQAKEEESEDANKDVEAKEDAEPTEEEEEEDQEKGEDAQDTENDVQDSDLDCRTKEGDEQSKEDDQTGEEMQTDNLDGCENDESHDVDTHECPMDIEENNIGGVIVTEHDNSAENQEDEQEKDDKETIETSETTDVAPTAIANGEIDKDVVSLVEDDLSGDETKKSIKRPRSESDPPTEETKKIKLDVPVKKQKKPVQLHTLNAFRDYMKDKGLKDMTRAHLEELCLQKMCECLVDKSELAELRQRVRILEQIVDGFRKDATTVTNQARDLKVVHEKVTTALRLAKEQKGKHLVPVKITRSVGLQAVLEHVGNKRHSFQNGIVQTTRTIPNNTLNNVNNNVTKNNYNFVNNSANNNSQNNGNNNVGKSPVRTQHSPAQTPTKSPLQQRTPVQQLNTKQIPQKENRTISTPRASPIQQVPNGPRKSTEPPKAVIDLTDEDEKTSSNTVNRTNARVNINNTRVNGQCTKTSSSIVTSSNSTTKLMMIPSTVLSRPVMLKVNSTAISQANGITIPPTSQVSIVAQPVTSKGAQQARMSTTNVTSTRSPVQRFRHPAPLPPPPSLQNQIVTQRPIPPRPHLNLTKSPCGTGIVLQWKMPYQLDLFETIVSYQLYAYQETKSPPRTDNWGKIGDVKALELPMAVTLTQFAVGNRYYFAVRAVDVHKRLGPFSDPQTILL